MAITYRNEKGSKVDKDEYDDSLRWLNESGEKPNGSTVLFDRHYVHAKASPETGSIELDLTGALPMKGIVIYYTGSSNPQFTGATPVFENSITEAGTWRIMLMYLGGTDIIGRVFNADGGGTSGGDSTAPSNIGQLFITAIGADNTPPIDIGILTITAA